VPGSVAIFSSCDRAMLLMTSAVRRNDNDMYDHMNNAVYNFL
jgi:acyl-ACP thioesterase